MYYLKRILIILFSLILLGCKKDNVVSSSNKDGSSTQINYAISDDREMILENNDSIKEMDVVESIDVVELNNTYKLTFVDSPVVNLTYQCGNKISKTDKDGNLTCSEFPIIFSALNLEIGVLEEMTDDKMVFPEDLVGVPRLETNNLEVLKIASFLQSIDDDGDVTKFIVIKDNDKIEKRLNSTVEKGEEKKALRNMSLFELREFLSAKGFNMLPFNVAEYNLRVYGLGLQSYQYLLNYPYSSPLISSPFNSSDITPPVVTLNGEANVSLYLNRIYVELNATAIDNVDGNVTRSIVIGGTVDSSVIGSTVLTYVATDSAGNIGSKTRTVNVFPVSPLKTGQKKSYNSNGDIVGDSSIGDGSLADDGFYQKGISSNFVRDDTREVVIDNLTGHMWQDDSSVKTVKKKWLTDGNYTACTNHTSASECFNTSGDTASTWCTDLTLGGYDDWRLPTIGELERIVNYTRVHPSINNIFQNTATSGGDIDYWSSTNCVRTGLNVWVISFNYATIFSLDKSESRYIRCVRDMD